MAGGGPAMLLVLLSLAALCWGAVPPEPVSTPSKLPSPAFRSLKPGPISSCSSEAFAEGHLKGGSGVDCLSLGRGYQTGSDATMRS